MISILLLSLTLVSMVALADTQHKKEMTAQELTMKKEKLAFEEGLDRINGQLLAAQRQIQDVRMHLITLEKKKKDVTSIKKELDAVQSELDTALQLLEKPETLDSKRREALAKKQTMLCASLKKLQAQAHALKLGKLSATSETAQKNPQQVQTPSLDEIKKQADEDDKTLDVVQDSIAELIAPTFFSIFGKKIRSVAPSRYALRQSTFLGAGAALLGGIYLSGEHPKTTPRWTQWAKKITGHLGYTQITSRDDQNRIADDAQEGLVPLPELSTGNQYGGLVVCQYKPGLLATPYKWYEQWRRRVGPQNHAAAESAEAVKQYFGISPQRLLVGILSTSTLKPVVEHLIQLRNKYAMADNLQQHNHADTTLESRLAQYGIPVNDETKSPLPKDELKERVEKFLADAAIDADEKDIVALAASFEGIPVGFMDVTLIDALNACRESKEPITSASMVLQTCKQLHQIQDDQGAYESVVASIAGKTLAAHLYETNATFIGATTGKIVSVVPVKTEKGIAQKIVTRLGEVFMSPAASQYVSAETPVLIGELKERIKMLIAGKIAQEEILLAGGTSRYSKKDNVLIGADDDDRLINQLCLRVVMHYAGLGSEDPTKEIQQQFLSQVAAERKALEEIVRSDIQRNSRKLEAIHWHLKDKGSLSAQQVHDLLHASPVTEQLEKAKGSVKRREFLMLLAKEIKDAEAEDEATKKDDTPKANVSTKSSPARHHHHHGCSCHHHA